MEVVLKFNTDADIGDEIEALNYALEIVIKKAEYNLKVRGGVFDDDDYWVKRLKRTKALQDKLFIEMEK